MTTYNHSQIEQKWQKYWQDHETFRAEIDPNKPKYYVLDMFPYPSGAGLHVGHAEGYVASDLVARYKRMNGFNVLHPMGWDAFGLPAERYAEKVGGHPKDVSVTNSNRYCSQLKALGLSYDWARTFSTTDPDYYKWTQWIFTKLYERGLAYEVEFPVNWCPKLGTVLANEEVKDGKYVETGDEVVKKPMRQWMLKITEYAERLLQDLDELDWPEGIKKLQRDWIGKSTGADITFNIDGSQEKMTVFTTRPDTLFGLSYCVLAPENPLALKISTKKQRDAVAAYIIAAAKKSAQDRLKNEKNKTGVFTGAYAINPLNNKKVPIYISDYVLGDYGYGAVMAVPAHDQRDYDFAKKFNLPIIPVIEGGDLSKEAWEGNGKMINSDFLNGLDAESSKEVMIKWLTDHNCGKKTINYKLRDWLFSRQRYWGEPFPIIHCEDGKVKALPLQDLPLTLPEMQEYKPTPDGRPPLARATEWIKTIDPETGKPAIREQNTMPQWAGSSWYFLRFCDPKNNQEACSKEAEKYWMPVDLYIGGAEHAVLHLLYARFWHKVLYDIGVVSTKEPFKKLFNQGMILANSFRDDRGKYYYPNEVENNGHDWVVKETGVRVNTQIEKMSKSRYNVVNPDEVVEKYGADTMRVYEMFMGPVDKNKPWTEEGINGAHRFVKRLHSLFIGDDGLSKRISKDVQDDENTLKAYNYMVKAVTEDFETLSFNTALARIMEFMNELGNDKKISQKTAEGLTLLVSPFVPHMAEEVWQQMGHTNTLAYEPWPKYDQQYLVQDLIKIPIQIQGKKVGIVQVPPGAKPETILECAMKLPNIQKQLDSQEIGKQIYVPNKILNLVLKKNSESR